MRMGVLDIGSNTGHLLVVDAHRGAAPLPAYSQKESLRLAEHLDGDGAVDSTGVDALVKFVREAKLIAEDKGCETVRAFATSAVREAANADRVLETVQEETDVELQVLAGGDEAKLTFLAVRRWFGWAAGQILLFDIGGGSLEIAAGSDELPDAAESVPLGAGRMTVQFLPEDPPGPEAIDALRAHAADMLRPVAERFAAQPRPDHVVGSSKAIRSLARLAGYPAPGWSSIERFVLPRRELKAWIPRLARIPAETRQELPGITADRTFQIVAGAVVLHQAMKAMDVEELEVSPWALREGVLLRYIESLSWNAPTA
jgi:exopolyphosphatase / guanosine-5'-triphosphate,3'-diphosphate pyrophosphatase